MNEKIQAINKLHKQISSHQHNSMYSTIHPLNQTGLSVEFREHHIEDHEEVLRRPSYVQWGGLNHGKKFSL